MTAAGPTGSPAPGDEGANRHPVTPDGRYVVVRGRLWRMSNPALATQERQHLVATLMQARRAVRSARRAGEAEIEAEAHAAVDRAKRALGERGPVWWDDGAPDLNRHMAKTTTYAGWFSALEDRCAKALASPATAKSRG